MKPSYFFLFICLCLFSNCTNLNKPKESSEVEETVKPEGTIIVDGASLKYKVEGRGKPCLVIGSSIYYPRTFSQNLRKNLQFYFVDMRWFADGKTSVRLKDYSIQSIADDIETVRKELLLEDFILLGHSIHGTIAMEYAKRYPEHISHLVMVGSPNDYANEVYNTAMAELWESASEERKKAHAENTKTLQEDLAKMSPSEAMVANYVASSAMYWYDANYDCAWIWNGMPINMDITNHIFGPLFSGYNMFEDNVKIDMPVLVALGKFDYVVPYTLWKSEYEQLPNLSVEIFEKSGHTPQLEEPALFDEKILKWINE